LLVRADLCVWCVVAALRRICCDVKVLGMEQVQAREEWMRMRVARGGGVYWNGGCWCVKCGGRRCAAIVRTKRMVVVEVLRCCAVVCGASRWSETAAAAVEVDGGG